jgi:hypothetical protein
MRTSTATAIALALAAAAATAAPATAATTGKPGTDGLWRMDDYGTVLSLDGDTLQEFQTTSVSCLKGDSARRTDPGTYATADGTTLTVRPRPGRYRATLGYETSVGHRSLRRIQELPAGCTRPTPQDPRTAFDVFWHSFAENYPFFAAKGVDWQDMRDRYRPKVHQDTTRKELVGIFSDMVRPLYDAHVAVRDGDQVFAQVRPGTEPPSSELDARVKKFITERDLREAPYREDFANGRITYADLPGRATGQGYLRISGFSGYAADDAPCSVHFAELDKALDTILTTERTQRLKGLIIDLRINGGGSDALGTVRIGQPTQGVFSDVMQRSLTNGMTAILPNEEFLNRSGRTYDGTGIPPHITEPMFTEEEFAENRDSAFDRAVSVLRNDG